ncbi:aldehyde dehydrogenase family protein [Defluviimonas sp. SAOS-178_SWC]|uniref:aldehyde dehydrogenase family protein n=1 Tax=Defluviimonas sp. SAOS-178_SWC TaxID=3121287 RepID=UPI003221D388
MAEAFGNYIGGTWRQTADLSENRNPARLDDVIGRYARGSAEDVDAAVEAGRDAQPAWAAATPEDRANVLDRAARLIFERVPELGELLAREEGKLRREAEGEVTRAANVMRFFAGEALRLGGEKIASVRAGCEVDVVREPLGVVGLITPWNFPIAIPAWKMAPALAAGNAVVIKPAEITPASTVALVKILEEAGLPAGVVNLVMGSGSVVGNRIVDHPDVRAVSFTGSERVGRQIALAGAEGMKKVQLEMGGKNPMVVMADADLDLAVKVCLDGAFFSTGQRCTASSRLIVEDRIHDAFVEKLDLARAAIRVGDPLEADSQMGPVVSEGQLESNLTYVAQAASEGCEVRGGERLNQAGYFQAPALFLNATNDMKTSQEEIFGPCASVIRVADFDEALATANDTRFGLSSGICTTSLRHATEFRRKSRAGMVMVNLPTAGVDYHVPFGGNKGSSLGAREQGPMAMEFYTSVKTAYSFAGSV